MKLRKVIIRMAVNPIYRKVPSLVWPEDVSREAHCAFSLPEDQPDKESFDIATLGRIVKAQTKEFIQR